MCLSPIQPVFSVNRCCSYIQYMQTKCDSIEIVCVYVLSGCSHTSMRGMKFQDRFCDVVRWSMRMSYTHRLWMLLLFDVCRHILTCRCILQTAQLCGAVYTWHAFNMSDAKLSPSEFNAIFIFFFFSIHQFKKEAFLFIWNMFMIEYIIVFSNRINSKFQNGMSGYVNEIAFLSIDATFHESLNSASFSQLSDKLNFHKHLHAIVCHIFLISTCAWMPGKPTYFLLLFVYLIFAWQFVRGNCVLLKIRKYYFHNFPAYLQNGREA